MEIADIIKKELHNNEYERLNEERLERDLQYSIKTIDRLFKAKFKMTLKQYHKNYVANNIIKTAFLEGKSVKKYFEEIIDKNINMYWSDYKAFNTFINNKNNIFNIITKFDLICYNIYNKVKKR